MNIQATGFRLTYLASLALVAGVASHAGAAVSSIDPEQQRVPDDLVLKAEFLSKLVDQGRIRNDDATAHVGGVARIGWEVPGSKQGIGVQVDGYFAVGEDQATTPKTSPGEMVEFNGKLSYVYEALDAGDIPMFQIIPHFEFITYPNVAERQNYLKYRQNYVGADAWYCLPWEGIEIGGGADWNMSSQAHMFRAAAGAREFYQDAPFDLSAWQLLNFGNKEYKRYFAGSGAPPPAPAGVDRGGFTTIDVGAKVTLPLPWNELWTFVQADAVYWVDAKDRRNLNNAGVDVGDFVISIGAEWRPE